MVLRAEGRGFNAGVDIKEMQATEGFDALIGANRGCYAAFAAVYECAVPVIAAVHGFCLGGGIGLVGNADVIVASDDATFGLPEVDRGALGAATHLARLVPQHKMRAMVYTSATATAQELHHFGSVLAVVEPERLRDAALEVAGQIAAKSPTVIRAAKESLNGIDPIDVKRSYRFEQGFTFELNLSGVADEARDAFVEQARRRLHQVARMTDKRMTEDDVVAELRDGMTIGIGGWGSRRKPMSLVRAILRSDLKDLTIVTYGGPDVGLLCAAGKVRKVVYGFVSLDTRSRSSRTSAAPARRARSRRSSSTRACSSSACRRRRGGCRSSRPGPGSAPTSSATTPELRTVQLALRRRRGAGRHAGAHARRRARPHEPRRRARQRPVPRPRPLLRRPDSAWRPSAASCRSSASSPPTSFAKEGPVHTLRINRTDT